MGNNKLRKLALEENAVAVVDEILNDLFNPLMLDSMDMQVAKCSRVSIVEKTGSNTFTGIAILDNGSILNIRIQDLGDTFIVKIVD